MKKLLILSLILLFPITASPHPGRTDKRGGHRCWKDCGSWGLYYGEYHLHDKNWKPIRLDKDGNPIMPLLQEQKEETTLGTKLPEQSEPPTPSQPLEQIQKKLLAEKTPPEIEKSTYNCMTIINPFLLILLALLLIALLIARRMRKDRKS